MIQGDKIVTASQMRKLERESVKAGAQEESYIRQAGYGIALEVSKTVQKLAKKKQLLLLLGKGNNAGDALAAGCHLLEMGFQIYAYALFPVENFSPLITIIASSFQTKGGQVISSTKDVTFCFCQDGCIIDGIFGTGYHSQTMDLRIVTIIALANASGIPIFAIDIPSGLNGDTGEVSSTCIHAYQTLYLGLPKAGFFLDQGYNYIGKITKIDFGLDSIYIEKAEAIGTLLHEEDIRFLQPSIKRTRHKYQAGYVLTIGGSKGMEGAAILAALAALRSGAGVSRLFFTNFEKQVPLEIITDLRNKENIYTEAKRSQAAIIGPGLGRSQEDFSLIQDLIHNLSIPLVIDADALAFLARYPQWYTIFPAILTPHRGELLPLLQKKSPYPDEKLMRDSQDLVDKKNCILIVKGAPTWVFSSKQPPLVITRGDPGMATAGTGDVLAGILGALLAQGLSPYNAAILGVYLHGVAGELAAKDKSSYSLIASDIIEYLPKAFLSL